MNLLETILFNNFNHRKRTFKAYHQRLFWNILADTVSPLCNNRLKQSRMKQEKYIQNLEQNVTQNDFCASNTPKMSKEGSF